MTADERRTGPPAGHADLDTLADLHAGGLGGPEADRVRAHLAGCGQCRAALAALDAVQDRLRSLPAPAMPAAVAARLDATLADLRTERPPAPAAATTADPDDEPDPTSRPTPTGAPTPDPDDELERARLRRGRRLSRAIGAAAAAVVVIAAGGAIASIVRSSGSSDTASSAGAGSAASAPAQPQSEGPAAKSADGGLAGNGSGGLAVPGYDRARLRAALPAIAARGSTPRTTGFGDPARQAACAASIPGTTGTLRGAERIRYDGQPAYVLVYAVDDRLTGFVVTEACGSAPGRPATVLDTVS